MGKKQNNKLPEVCLLKISGRGRDGDLTAVVAEKKFAGDYKIFVSENRRIKPALSEGDEVLARLRRKGDVYWAKPMVRTAAVGAGNEIFCGVVEKRNGHYYVRAAEKNARQEYLLEKSKGLKDGDFVKVSLSGERRFHQAFVIENMGPFDLNKASSSLVLDKYDIPYLWNTAVAGELKRLPKAESEGRLDLTQVPLVTVDGDDSKDFDDAVWAEQTAGGFNLIVAIVDVAFYVRPGSELDREAYRRGNSVYLPNKVIPMLPEKLSNDLCSLNPQQKRPCLACLMRIDNNGNLLTSEFKRAVMKSAARLTYREVQNAWNGDKSSNVLPVFQTTVMPLYYAYQALDKARKKRGALELNVPEYKIKTDKDGNVCSIMPEEENDANRMIESFMVAANVAAAQTLEKFKLPIMFRVHDKPPVEKAAEFKPLAESLGMKFPDMTALKPAHLNKLLAKGDNSGIGMMILRLQAQAQYSPDNIGHFGLALKDYVHFTSPIRRYADLLIHRALIRALDMGEGALEAEATKGLFTEIGKHLVETERKAVSAERDMAARFTAAYVHPCIGQDFEVRIVGITTAGLFVRIDNLGAEGLIPLSSLPDDDYDITDGNLALEGTYSGLVFAMGEVVTGRLTEAVPATGSLTFKYVDPEDGVGYYEKKSRKTGRRKQESKQSRNGKNIKKTKRKVKKND